LRKKENLKLNKIMLSISDLKPGVIFSFQNQIFEVLEVKHLHLGRQGAVLQAKIRNLRTGEILYQNFKPGQEFGEVEIERVKAKFLYSHRGKFCFVSPQNPKERYIFEEKQLKEVKNFLVPGVEVTLLKKGNEILNISLPIKVALKVLEAPPDFRGNTQEGSKVVTLETGLQIKVPFFIQKDDIILVNTQTGEYIERLKKANEKAT
jgi:elongation factor P